MIIFIVATATALILSCSSFFVKSNFVVIKQGVIDFIGFLGAYVPPRKDLCGQWH